MSKTTRATSVTSRTPTSTWVRNWGLCGPPRALSGIASRRIFGARLAQPVADGPLGVDHIGPVPGELASQVADVGRHHCARTAKVVVPDVVEYLRPGQHASGVEHQVAHQPELRRRKVDRVAGPADLVAVLIELDIGERQQGQRTGARPRASQYRSDPGREFLEPERLRHVIVAAEGEPGDLVRLRVPGGQEDHGNAAAIPAQPADDLESIRVGQHDIEHHQIEWPGSRLPQRVSRGIRRRHLEAEEAQRGRDGVAQEGLVVYHEQFAAVMTAVMALASGQLSGHRLAPRLRLPARPIRPRECRHYLRATCEFHVRVRRARSTPVQWNYVNNGW